MQTGRSTKEFWQLIATHAFWRHFSVVLLTLGYIFISCPAALAATGDSAEQIYEIQNGLTNYNPNATCASTDSTAPANPGVNIDTNAANSIITQTTHPTKGTPQASMIGYAVYTSAGDQVGENTTTSTPGSSATTETYGASITKAMLLIAYLSQEKKATLSSTATAELTGMIEQSNDADANDIYNLLSDPAGEVGAVAKEYGMAGFEYNDTADSLYRLGQSQITAQDFALFFANIFKSTVFNNISAANLALAKTLLSTITPDVGLLKANLPGTLYSKEGWKPEPGGGSDPPVSGNANPYGLEGAPWVVNQAAQFQSGNTIYGVAITVAGAASETAGETIIQNVASALITNSNQAQTTNSCSCNGGDNGSNIGKVGTVNWQSNAQTPYYLEEFIINILEALASTTNHPESDALTKEHVIAMTAWAYAEGGNIANTDIFNVWNTGIGVVPQYAYLLQGGASASGVESFKSFNYGVDAMVISVTQSTQSRIGSILLNPSSSAQQVLDAIADYQNYPGNGEWAGNPQYQELLDQMLTQTSSDYAQEASVEIGPGQEGQSHVPTSDLKYSSDISGVGTGSSGSTTTTACLTSDVSANCPQTKQAASGDSAILACAEQYAGIFYDWGGGHTDYATFRQNCPLSQLTGAPKSPAALASASGDPGPCGTDCSGLVSMALDQAFDLDDGMTVSSSGVMLGSGAQYWKEISPSQAHPGDIVTLADSTGHVEIVDTNSGGTFTTFGSHHTGATTGEVSSTPGYWAHAYTWTGPGSTNNVSGTLE